MQTNRENKKLHAGIFLIPSIRLCYPFISSVLVVDIFNNFF